MEALSFSPAEIAAAQAYRADSTFLHAHKQGWDGTVFRTPAYTSFLDTCGPHQIALDSAILKNPLSADTVLWSGHGRGSGVVGALVGEPKQFVGLGYKYPGYISTSAAKQVALDTLVTRAKEYSRPTLLELHLPLAFHALDMSLIPGGGHEFEYLIGRNEAFTIFDADLMRSGELDVLLLRLRPTVQKDKT